MKPQDYIAVGLRLLAIYIAIYTSIFLGNIISLISGDVLLSGSWELLIPLFVGFGMALVLWFLNMTIAYKLLPVSVSQTEISYPVSTLGLLRVGMILLGLFLLSSVFRDGGSYLYYFTSTPDRVEFDLKGQWFGLSLQFLFALILIIGNRGLSQMLGRLQGFGLDAKITRSETKKL